MYAPWLNLVTAKTTATTAVMPAPMPLITILVRHDGQTAASSRVP